MSRDKLIILGVVLLGLLGFLVYKQAKKDEAIGVAVASTKDLPTVSVPEDVDRIELTNGDKAPILLVKVPDPKAPPSDGGAATMWQLAKPILAPANQQTVKDLVANLKDLKVDSAVNLKLDDEVKKDKQLDAAHALRVVVSKNGDKKLDALFGKSGPAGELAMLSDRPDQVWAIKGYSAFLYTKDPKDFRDKDILKFDDANVTQVTIVNSHGTLSFTKGDKWAATADKNPLARFDEGKLKDMLRAYKVLSADDFGDGKVPAETGLDKPAATVSIVLKDGAGKYDVLIGGAASGTNHWVKRADSDAIYQITNYAAEWATTDASKYQGTASDAGAGDAGKPAAPVMPPK